MGTREIAQEFTQLCKDGRFEEAGRKFWSDDIVSLEPMDGPMARSAGLKAVHAKGEWWYANHEVHSMRTEGPFVHGEQFAVIFDVDVTPKVGERAGQRMAMREVVKWIIKRETWLEKNAPRSSRQMITHGIAHDPDNADAALLLLGIIQPRPRGHRRGPRAASPRAMGCSGGPPPQAGWRTPDRSGAQ